MDDDVRAAARREDAALVERARADDDAAFGQLYDRWFDRVHDLAFRVTKDSSAANDVAQDAFLAAWNNLPKLQDPQAFGGWLLRITRNAALDRARREQRSRPYDAEGMAIVESAGPSPVNAPIGFRIEDRAGAFDDPERAAEDADLVALVWESAAALGARDAELLDLSLRHGLTPAEVGDVVGMNRNAANQAVHRVRNRLKTAIEARVLWRSGEPVCAGLAVALDGAGIEEFGPDAVRLAGEHAATCAECQGRRETRLEPSKLFGAMPFVIVPMLLKMKVAHALSESGVPMDGSEAFHFDGRGHRRMRRRARHVFVVTGTVVIVAFVGVGVAADRVHEVLIADTSQPTTTTLIVTTTTTAPTTTPSTTTVTEPSTTPTTTKKIYVPPPPPPPPASASISVSPASEPNGYTFGRVVLTWSSSGGSSVRVVSSGPDGLISTAASGAESVCPGTIRSGGCYIAGGFPQTFTYTVNVYDANGAIVASKSATLTIT
jgi:RNA polymerase sigma factor (sigma-70 family)